MRRLEAAFLSSGTSPERIAPESLTPSQCGFVHRNISGRALIAALDQVWRGPTRQGFGPESLRLRPTGSRIRSGEESTGILSRHSGLQTSVVPGWCVSDGALPSPREQSEWRGPRRAKLALEGWGWGAAQQTRCQRHARRDPPPPTPPHHARCAREEGRRRKSFVIPGWCVSTRPGISRFRVRCFASPRNDEISPHCVFATCGGVACVMNSVACSIAVPSGVGITIRNGTRMRVPATGAKAISMLRWAVRYLITARSGM